MKHQYRSLFEKIKNGELNDRQARNEIQKVLGNKKIDDTLYQKTLVFLKSLLSPIIKAPAERINADVDFDKYGINSIMIMELTEELEKNFAELPKTLFYEYSNLGELAKYFAENYTDTLCTLLGVEEERKAKLVHSNEKMNKNENEQKTCKTKKEEYQADDIAIIGIAGRYPKSDNIDAFWENLQNGCDCISEIPVQRWDYQKYFSEKKGRGSIDSKWGGFLSNVDEFDSLLFNISPVEADRIDPQERIFLQCVYTLFEDAGYTKRTIRSDNKAKVGVFVGVMYEEYQFYGIEEQQKNNMIALGGNSSSIANRVSYVFNLNGPSMALNTMCSSSLTSVHLACQSIQTGECDAAIAGGVNISVHPNKYITLAQGNFASSKGRCESFGNNGDGYVPGEGVGAILIKPLSKAVADNDHIYGIIKGSAINHCGKTNGYTVPNPNMQAEVIESALKRAKVNPRTISYLEAHGTGTILGDPIEITGLEKVYKRYSDDYSYCAIGSVKSNIGHCEGAAGIAAITKVLLQMKYQKLVPSLHSSELNQKIDFNHSPFVVQQTLQDWKEPILCIDGVQNKYPRRAGISAFGAGGSNAHVILEEYKNPVEEEILKNVYKQYIIVLSARTKEKLLEKCKQLYAAVERNSFQDKDLSRIAYTLQTGRDEMDIRLGFVVSSISELIEKLMSAIEKREDRELCFHEIADGILQDKEEKERRIIELIKQKEYREMIELWATGYSVEWDLLYDRKKPMKISLPSYPFDKKKYWYKKRNTDKEESPLYIPIWEKYNEVSSVTNLYEHQREVLFVYRESSTLMMEILEEYFVSRGIYTEKILLNDEINLEYYLKEKEEIGSVFFLSDMVSQESNHLDENEMYFLRFAKAIKKYVMNKKPIDCYILTFDNYCRSYNQINFTGGGITGLAYSLAQSSAGLKVRNLDLSVEEVKHCESKEELAELIIKETPSVSGEAVMVQLSEIYKQKFYRVINSEKEKFSSDGVYVILGGTGTVGTILTRFLIQTYNAKVVWLGRKDKESDDVVKKQLLCTYQGNKPGYIQADVTKLEQIQNAVAGIRDTYKKIHGAIFSGAVFDIHNEIATTTVEQFTRILSIKTIGSINFYKAFEYEDLDFLCYFSSGQSFSFSPAGNLCAYASGITFTDTYVRYLQKEAKFPVGCINWGFWSGSASEAFGKNLNNCISDEQGCNFFVRAVSLIKNHSVSQVVCMDLEKIEGLESKIKQEFYVPSILSGIKKEYDTREFIQTYSNKLDFPVELQKAIVKMLFVKTRRFLNTIIADKYILWMDECKRILQENNAIKMEYGKVIVTEDFEILEEESVVRQWEKIVDEFTAKEDYKSSIVLLNKCLRYLPEILEGKTSATNIIFPNGSMELVEDIYSNNSIEDFYNTVLSEYAVDYVEKCLKYKKAEKIRLLEVGAGTGGTSSIVLEKLKAFAPYIEYHYTDVSNSFLMFAQEKFAEYRGFMKFQIWNVEEQYRREECFDLILATNVLHSTKNIQETLKNIHAIMRKNGILLINEITEKNIVETLTFGLLDGWWRFDDPEFRILGSPLINNKNWKDILHICGYPLVLLPLEHSEKINQQIIIAESDGVEALTVENVIMKKEIGDVKTAQESRQQIIETVSVKKEEVRKDTELKHSLENSIKEILCEVLNIDQDEIKLSKAFSDYGLDSILGGKFIRELNESLNLVLNNAILFDYTSIELLSTYIMQCYREKVVEKYGYVDINNSASDIVLSEPKGMLSVEPMKIEKTERIEKIVYKESDRKIAVIGMSGQFPDALNVEKFWSNLVSGKNCVHELPKEYLDQETCYSKEQQKGKSYCKWGGILSEKEYFEPLFFNISPRDAEDMSIHQRLILQEGWKAIEDAGYNPKEMSGSQTGVFIGAEPSNSQGKSFIGTSDAIVSSRLAYFLNLNGPSLTINTGCSSSAVAIHLACENLINGSVDLAIAGGIFADLNQQSLIALSEIAMLSHSSRCHTFDESADGTVMSEGVGIIVLKRLEDAIKDGDSIYGVISASGMNQDGASNGITAPNGRAQEKLIRTVYKNANINPSDISYIETHGTGTKLGDPVEFNALDRVFKKKYTSDKKCVIGSVKANIGHTGAASGVIGLIKVLLCMKHNKVPGMYGFENVNSLINLEQSVFQINKELFEWTRFSRPRMAAINSFGHSGTNVHIVVEEYPQEKINSKRNISESHFIPISANNEESLKSYCERLAAWIDNNEQDSNIDLGMLAYTLQNGREEMPVRVLFLVESLNELSDKLKKFAVDGVEAVSNCWFRILKKGEKSLEFLSDDAEMKNVVQNWFSKGLYTQIAKLWIVGINITWPEISEAQRIRLHVPSYSFKSQRFSMGYKGQKPEFVSLSVPNNFAVSNLVQENISNFSNIIFKSRFTGNESFLHDHVINGHKIFPGTGYIEMANEAVRFAVGQENSENKMICLEKIVWVNPLFVENEANVRIMLKEKSAGVVSYQIYQDSQHLLNQGIAHVIPWQEQKVNISSIKERCEGKTLSHEQCYERFGLSGFNYGNTFKGIQKLYFNNTEALAKIHLELNKEEKGYVLHPGLFDSALQAVAGLNGCTQNDGSLQLPYVIEKLVIRKPLVEEMWSYVRCNKQENKMKIKYDIEICDSKGNSCVSISGYSMNQLKKENLAVSSKKVRDLLIMSSYMDKMNFENENGEVDDFKHIVVVTKHIYQKMQKTLDIGNLTEMILLETEAKTVEDIYKDYACQLIENLKHLVVKYFNKQIVIQLLYGKEEEYCQALGSILKTAKCEHPKLLWETVCISTNTITNELFKVRKALMQNEIEVTQNNSWLTKKYEEFQSDGKIDAPWKDYKVYLISGGAGKLGFLFARDIVEKTVGVTIIIIGRSELNSEKYEEISSLNMNGANVMYYQMDITNAEAVKQVLDNVRKEVGEIEGIIHCAGIIKDNYIVKTTVSECKDVLDVKVKGISNLHEATKNMHISFFVCCSSYAGAFGNAGQAAYSAANSYMDIMSILRNKMVKQGKCYGKTLSINWPFWENGGMKVTKDKIEKMSIYTGMEPLTTKNGLKALYLCINNMEGQVIIMQGDKNKIKETLFVKSVITRKENQGIKDSKQSFGENSSRENKSNMETFIDKVKQIISDIIHVSIQDVDVVTEFSEYGFDSVTYTEFTNAINEKYDINLIPTVFYEYNNINRLSQYVQKEYKEVFDDPAYVIEEIVEPEELEEPEEPFFHDTFGNRSDKIENEKEQGVAIVGISAKFPGAKDVDAFWENLSQGKESIIEIPKERWDWREYYGDSKKETGKTKVKWGGFIDGVDEFDPLFFEISPKQAELMDPKQRLILEHVWKAIEDAGYAPSSLAGKKIGVFIGTGASDYGNIIERSVNVKDGYSVVGNAAAMIPNRVSYFMDFHGPSEPIDTACSSSLIAIHRAACAILSGACESALVGGINVMLTPDLHISFSKANMLSEDGHCKTFSDEADGYVRGEGVGVIYIKKLQDAIKDHDHIYGVIRGTSENHGGRANSITAPNPVAQRQVLKEAYENAGIHPCTVTYIEAHGTGTKLGDPIEYNSLCEVFVEKYEKLEKVENPIGCGLGSVKTNIGHLEFASGIAGIIKVLLQFKNKTIVKTLNCEHFNPYLKTENSPLFIVQENRVWEQIVTDENKHIPRRAGISSFGFGGVNAHVVLEEYEKTSEDAFVEKEPLCFVFSAKTDDSLKNVVKEFVKAIELEKIGDKDLFNMSFTLKNGREQMQSRLLIVADCIKELNNQLKKFIYSDGSVRIFDACENRHNFDDVIKQWGKGRKISWEESNQEKQLKRMSLPTYEFEKGSYWVEKKEKRINNKIRLLEKQWKNIEINNIIWCKKGIVLILCTDRTISLAKNIIEGSELQPAFFNHGVMEGENFYKTDFYSVEKCKFAYEKFKRCLEGNKFVGVIDLTAYDDEYEKSCKVEKGKISLLQKVVEEFSEQYIRVLQVTHLLQNFDNPEVTLFGGRLYGLYKMLQAEYKTIRSSVMDSDLNLKNIELLSEQIKKEFISGESENVTECCYRNQKRYIPFMSEYATVSLDAVEESKFSEQDVIMVTGGLGGIGRSICNKVIGLGVKKIVLIGKEKLPGVNDQKVQNEVRSSISVGEKMAQIKKWKEQDVDILYFDLDLTDKSSLERIINEVHVKWGKITGVFHCAGKTGRNPMFHKKNIEDICAVCEPKMEGLSNLDLSLGHEELKFFILFSSVSGIIPKLSAGISDYAMANAYMDCFSAHKNSQNYACIKAIQWPAWEGVGMSQGVPYIASANMGINSMTSEEAITVLLYLAANKTDDCMPCIANTQNLDIERLLEVPEINYQNEAKHFALSDVQEFTKNWLVDLFVKELKIDRKRLEKNKPFEEYGVDSIVIAQLVETLKTQIGTELPSSLLVEYRTIYELNEYFITNHKEQMEKIMDLSKNTSFQNLKDSEEEKHMKFKMVADDDLAIVGISCRFPGAAGKEEFWKQLLEGKINIKEKPLDRWFGKEERKDYGGWLDGTGLFDEKFFHINRSDASVMDPQARVILEESLEAIYDAGYELSQVNGQNIGVYIGGRGHQSTDLETILSANNPILGMGQNYMASNISRFFDFRGPCMVVDTACSSGITALMMAGDSLRQKRINMAVVGAVSLLDDSVAHDVFEKRNILSKKGEFKIFDKNANGDVLGEGCGVVIVKLLKDAITDGNHIYGVVKGIGVNNNGKTLGPGSPNLGSQKEVMKAALHQAGKTPEDIDYIEVNGGGTVLMDSIEIKALSEAYDLKNKQMKECMLGCIKPNVGHLLLASGMASFIRCLLSVYNKKMPPFAAGEELFDEYDFDASRIHFNREVLDWNVDDNHPRCAALNVFPDGGTNYHVIIEEFIPDKYYVEKISPKKSPELHRSDYSVKKQSLEEVRDTSIRSVWGTVIW